MSIPIDGTEPPLVHNRASEQVAIDNVVSVIVIHESIKSSSGLSAIPSATLPP